MSHLSTAENRTPRISLADLESAYVWSVNQALEVGSTGLAAELADSYRQEANDLLAGRAIGSRAA